MSILITGAKGMLGQDFIPLVRDEPHHAVARSDVDLADTSAVRAFLDEVRPKLIYHLAAFTQVDLCETEAERAERDNAGATDNLAQWCAENGSRLIFVSTDYVFDGTATAPIPPDAPKKPINAYGRSKRHAEEAIERSGANGLIVRTSWLIGAGGKNFVEAIRGRARKGQPLRVVDDQRGSPTFTFDLAPALLDLGRASDTGAVHLTNSGECTWFDLAAEILRLEGLDVPLERTTTASFAAPAKRPAYSVLDNSAAIAILGRSLPPWQESLAKYLRLQPGELSEPNRT